MKAFPSEDLLNRIADTLVRGVSPDKLEEERAGWLDLIRPKPDSSPEQHREWVAHVVREISIDVGDQVIREVDALGPMSQEDLDQVRASVFARFDECERLEAEVLGNDLAMIEQVHGWGD